MGMVNFVQDNPIDDIEHNANTRDNDCYCDFQFITLNIQAIYKAKQNRKYIDEIGQNFSQ